ncbi:MAG: hypothetical protein ACOYBW_01190 [Fluviibacter phosphoraccumulans]
MNPRVKIGINKDGIPAEVKAKRQWVCWIVGKSKPNGKFDKVPVDPKTRMYTDGTKPENWLFYEEAIACYETGRCDGIGIGLSSDPFAIDEIGPLYLVAVDLDSVFPDKESEAKDIWQALGKPYAEISPSGTGVRMLLVSRRQIEGGNDGNGHELYSKQGRFVTITGQKLGGHND